MKKLEVINGKVKVDGKIVPNVARWGCHVDPTNGLTVCMIYSYDTDRRTKSYEVKTFMSHRGYPETITIKQETP